MPIAKCKTASCIVAINITAVVSNGAVESFVAAFRDHVPCSSLSISSHRTSVYPWENKQLDILLLHDACLSGTGVHCDHTVHLV